MAQIIEKVSRTFGEYLLIPGLTTKECTPQNVSLKTPLRIPNAPGTIDCGYRDEVNVIVYNDSFMVEEGVKDILTLDQKGCVHGTYKIRKGDRIAQMVVARVEYCKFVETDNVKSIGEDRGGGFGSSGVN